MASPFPGMDPYLERQWRDVHGTLIVHARAALQRQLGGGLRARIEERLVVEGPAGGRSVYPEVRVVDYGIKDRPIVAEAGVAVAEPLVVTRPSERARQRYIEIIDPGSGGTVVTVVELVSPTNKVAGDGRLKYRRKQREVIGAGVNLVEIDLTRGRRRQLGYPSSALPKPARATYLACAYRGFDADRFELYPIRLRDRLPAIRVPLRPSGPDVALDLQPLVHRAYEEGAYDDIDYREPCDPPLTGEEAAWADTLLKAAGRR